MHYSNIQNSIIKNSRESDTTPSTWRITNQLTMKNWILNYEPSNGQTAMHMVFLSKTEISGANKVFRWLTEKQILCRKHCTLHPTPFLKSTNQSVHLSIWTYFLWFSCEIYRNNICHGQAFKTMPQWSTAETF